MSTTTAVDVSQRADGGDTALDTETGTSRGGLRRSDARRALAITVGSDDDATRRLSTESLKRIEEGDE